jgi:hypothetical protein
MADRRGFQKDRPKMEKRKQRDERKEAEDVDRKEDTKGMPRKEQVPISRLGPKMEGVRIHYAPSATPIYLLTTYCANAKKLRTRE